MKKLTQILIILLTTFLLNSCDKDDTSNLNSSQTYDCINGNCINAGSTGTFNSLSNCESSCGNNNSETFDCINGNCVNAGSNGSYSSLSDCQNSCGNNNIETFDCVNGNCINAGSNGSYNSLSDCQNSCGNNTETFDCVNGNCISAGSNGSYSSLSDCQSNCSSNYCPSSFTDPRDGNTYDVVQIGNQCWFANNLEYSGNILEINSTSAWSAIDNTQQPAWCYYDNNPGIGAIYGKLYNWHAVNTGTLCPSGWHIPSDAEWTELANYLGGENVAGGKMKYPAIWNPPNTGATNTSGFKGLPGSFQYHSGGFHDLGYRARWWSSTEESSYSAIFRSLYYTSTSLSYGSESKNEGYSCRCIKD